MRYRRASIGGATDFFTVNLAERSSRLLVDRVDALRQVVRRVWRAHPFEILAWVAMPDHIHAIWRLPGNDADYSTRWALIKAGFSRTTPEDRTDSLGPGSILAWQHLMGCYKGGHGEVAHCPSLPELRARVRRAIGELPAPASRRPRCSTL